jgi:omega-hydroxy-beta-dihydromenaquinone-9 sulfotransferase
MFRMATSATSFIGQAEKTSSVAASSSKPPWAPRMWQGCDLFGWLRLLLRNRFAVHWSCWYIAVIVTFFSFWHSLLKVVQEAIYGRRIGKTIIRHPPIFILGHWRSGTTLLHEFLIQDERHSFPTTYACMAPNHFLLTEDILSRWLKFLVPSRRQMDNMKAGFDRPQEDEFALCMLGQPSPYLTVAFPNRPPQCQEYLDLKKLPSARVRSWKRTFLHFLKQVTFRDPRRLVLKSPPHTARISVLKEMFPDALFVHIVRDPYVVFASTVNLWRTLYRTQGLQRPAYQGLEELVLNTYTLLYNRLEEGKKLLDPRQFYELKYEDLVSDPVGELAKLYEHFQLGGFSKFLPRLQRYLAGIRDYETNRYQLTPRQRQEIARRWGDVIRRYGYEDDEAAL